MPSPLSLIVLGTFDSKGEEHLFLKERISSFGFNVIAINVGTKAEPLFKPDYDLFKEISRLGVKPGRDEAIDLVISRARALVHRLFQEGSVSGIISAGGGTGTHICTSVMKVLPLGIPKIMVSTVASRDMSAVVSTKDITMMHSVVDLLGVNSISGAVLDRAAAALCAMAGASWRPGIKKRTIALTMFGFITEGAEHVKRALEAKGYEVIAFHANGTGGNAMEELASEGLFDGILDLATHEFADELKKGYCKGIGPDRLKPHEGVPRLVVPGGLDCAVLEFTRQNIPEMYRDRAIFFYDFRSAVRLSREETKIVASMMASRINTGPLLTKVLIPLAGWSEADRKGGALYDPSLTELFVEVMREELDPRATISLSDTHVNDPSFAEAAALLMDEMVRSSGKVEPLP